MQAMGPFCVFCTMLSMTKKEKKGVRLRFTVGSLRNTSRRAGGIDFRHELGLLKAALLYADEVELVSVAGSFMASMEHLGQLPRIERLALMRHLMPIVDPEASEKELTKVYRLIDSATNKLEKNRRLAPDEIRILTYLKEKWPAIEKFVEEAFDEWGVEDFRTALRSGLVGVRPFTQTTPEKILEMGRTTGRRATKPFADKSYDEYCRTVVEVVNEGNTYPLFDDLTGNIVGRAVRRRLVLPTPAAKRRSKHGGLSRDLLQRLPMFEKADISEVLNIREQLSETLGAFREAVADSASTIESASWEVDRFTEEAEIIFQEIVAPAVDRIQQQVEEDVYLKELTYRYGPSLLGGVASIGAFVGNASVLAELAALAAGLSAGLGAVATAKEQRKSFQGERLYFYYRAGKLLRR